MGGLPFCAGSALIGGPLLLRAPPCRAAGAAAAAWGQLCVQRGDEHSFFETLCD